MRFTWTRFYVVLTILFVLAIAGVANSQVQRVVNPSLIAFDCPDHGTDTGHQLAIIAPDGVTTVQTLELGDPLISPDGSVQAEVNVQPTAMNRGYTFRVRASADTPTGVVYSTWSIPSEQWDRAPGGPSIRSIR